MKSMPSTHTESVAEGSKWASLVPQATVIAAALLLLGFGTVALAGAGKDIARAGVLIGADDDNFENPQIQPPDSQIDQSLSNGDVLIGRDGPDVMIGLLGPDVLQGGADDDILVGGPEGFVAPNKDIILGGSGNDINIWSPGDGSDAFLGGEGARDAMVFGIFDRQDGVPVLSPSPGRLRTGIPTVDTTNLPGFCVLEPISRRDTGFDYLVRFFTFSDGLLKVTVRLRDVEQLFCSGPGGGAIAYADLTEKNPVLEEVSLFEVSEVNPLVGKIIR